MNFNGIIDETDCLQMDGVYKFGINKILETHKNLKSINFTCPIRKEVNCNFVECELSYNKEFGGKRSEIETWFADFGDYFEKFGSNKAVYGNNFEIINLEYKLCCFLYNIKQFVKIYKINTPIIATKWMNDDFDYGFDLNEEIESFNLMEQQDLQKEILNYQNNALKRLLDCIDNIEESRESENNEQNNNNFNTQSNSSQESLNNENLISSNLNSLEESDNISNGSDSLIVEESINKRSECAIYGNISKYYNNKKRQPKNKIIYTPPQEARKRRK
ncbi:hypothetical protein ABK040_002364 [Willaertia magna]